MTRQEWTDPAIDDLQHARDYIARDSPQYAIALVERLIISAERIKSFPESGRRVPEASDPKVRELLVGGYRVIYPAEERYGTSAGGDSWCSRST
jgi:toxin ParE1/3/4